MCHSHPGSSPGKDLQRQNIQSRDRMQLPHSAFFYSLSLTAAGVLTSPPIRSSTLRPLHSRQALNCLNFGAPFDGKCWKELNVDDWLRDWDQTNRCPGVVSNGSTTDVAVNDGSRCCQSTEAWSTCFLRLTLGRPGYNCTAINLQRCPFELTPTDTNSTSAPRIKYVLEAIFSESIASSNELQRAYVCSCEQPLHHILYRLAVCSAGNGPSHYVHGERNRQIEISSADIESTERADRRSRDSRCSRDWCKACRIRRPSTTQRRVKEYRTSRDHQPAAGTRTRQSIMANRNARIEAHPNRPNQHPAQRYQHHPDRKVRRRSGNGHDGYTHLHPVRRHRPMVLGAITLDPGPDHRSQPRSP